MLDGTQRTLNMFRVTKNMLLCKYQQNELEKENEELNLQLKTKKAKKAKFTVKTTERKSASFFSDNEDYEDSDEDPDWIATPRVIKVLPSLSLFLHCYVPIRYI